MRSLLLVLRVGLVVGVVLLLSACTSTGETEVVGTTSTAPAGSVDAGPDGETTPSDEEPVASEPLGFAKDVYAISVPEVDPETGVLAVVDSEDLLQLGVEEGVWDEAEGVRAIISVLMGELPPRAVPDLADLPHKGHSKLLDHAEGIMADESITTEARADLRRLTAFFFADELPQPAAGAQALPVSYQLGCPVGSVTLSEMFDFKAPDTSVCYWPTFTDDGDEIFVPVTVEEVDEGATIHALEELLARARSGYLELAGFELPEVRILVSTEPGGDDAGQAISRLNGASCRVTLFNTPSNIARAGDFRHTVAHELFHCIQNEWEGKGPGFTTEGGAEYFAYRLLGECVPTLTYLNIELDVRTTTESLLDLEYPSWYFWAYLDEHSPMSSRQIANLHRSIAGGADQSSALQGEVPNLSKVLNEFYVRLMGPGLACGLQGTEVTADADVDDVSIITLNADFWVGTRYRLNYDKKKLFEQSDLGGGPMGMAPEDARSSEDDWVVVAEEVRSTCSEREPMLVVVTSTGDAPEQRQFQVDEVTEAVCDPCLIGSWSVDMDTLETFYEASPGALDMDLAGTVRFEFKGAPGATTAEVADERKFTMTVQGQSIVRDGSGTAQYSGDEQFLAISDYVESGAVSVLNSSSPFAGLQAGSGQGAYTCEGDELTVTRPEGASFTAVRDPATPEGDPYFES